MDHLQPTVVQGDRSRFVVPDGTVFSVARDRHPAGSELCADLVVTSRLKIDSYNFV